MAKLWIYSLEEVEDYESEEEAEDRKEYLERVQGKICAIYKG